MENKSKRKKIKEFENKILDKRIKSHIQNKGARKRVKKVGRKKDNGKREEA